MTRRTPETPKMNKKKRKAKKKLNLTRSPLLRRLLLVSLNQRSWISAVVKRLPTSIISQSNPKSRRTKRNVIFRPSKERNS